MQDKEFHNVYDELEWRGTLFGATPGSKEALNKQKVAIYVGFDPTSDSLHIGNLIPIVGLMRMQEYGHTPIAVLGDGTGMIGDPAGKKDERPLMEQEQMKRNMRSIKSQIERFLDFETKDNPAILVSNAEWLYHTRLIDFLRDIGKNFSINTMLHRDSVKERLKHGISFTEFSYQILQAYDFLYLYKNYGCTFQCGGSDQWGNILGGVHLIKQIANAEAHALVYPLITDSSGNKFGKSTINTPPTLNLNKTKPYDFYQFFLNTADADVIRYLKLFTKIRKKEISELERSIKEEPSKRIPHKQLAEEVTRMVQGEQGLQQALQQTKSLFSNTVKDHLIDTTNFDLATIKQDELHSFKTLQSLLLKVFSSNNEIKKLVEQGGLTINESAISMNDLSQAVSKMQDFPYKDTNGRQIMVIRRGKRNYKLIAIETR